MFSACWVAQDYSHRTPGRAQSCQERPRNIIFRPNRWRRRAPPPPHHQITSRARRTTSSAPYSPVPFLRSDSVLRLQATRDLELPFSLSLSRPRVRLPPRDTARSVRRGGGGAKPGGRGKRMASEDGCGGGNPPGDAAAAPPVWNAAPAAGAGCGDLEEDLRFQCCVCLWVTPRLLSVFFLRPCCSDLCRRMSRRSPFVDWTFVLRDYAPSLLIQCNSPLIFVVDIFFFASILCSIHCAVPKFLRSDIKLRYC